MRKVAVFCSFSPPHTPEKRSFFSPFLTTRSESFAGAINLIVRYFHNPPERRSLYEEACLLLGVDRFEIKGGGVTAEQFAAMATTPGLCREMYKLVKMGFKTKTMFAGTRHIWDFLEKLHHKVRTELESDPETLFHKAVETANSTSWPKTVKFEWLVAYGAGHHVLHVWLELIASGVKDSTLYDDATIFRYPDRSQLLFAMVRYLLEFSFQVHVSHCCVVFPTSFPRQIDFSVFSLHLPASSRPLHSTLLPPSSYPPGLHEVHT